MLEEVKKFFKNTFNPTEDDGYTIVYDWEDEPNDEASEVSE